MQAQPDRLPLPDRGVDHSIIDHAFPNQGRGCLVRWLGRRSVATSGDRPLVTLRCTSYKRRRNTISTWKKSALPLQLLVHKQHPRQPVPSGKLEHRLLRRGAACSLGGHHVARFSGLEQGNRRKAGKPTGLRNVTSPSQRWVNR